MRPAVLKVAPDIIGWEDDVDAVRAMAEARARLETELIVSEHRLNSSDSPSLIELELLY